MTLGMARNGSAKPSLTAVANPKGEGGYYRVRKQKRGELVGGRKELYHAIWAAMHDCLLDGEMGGERG